ncbi:helix-hairpin-helix domain-containing protein [Reichenbachiella sp. MALMAid0571]|uniref:ComEA family DNA-binding protein n=1 Tax=Reichenbachiella sp. MALMAid0571 TaxID=3143939 RepID=UPI0032DE3FF4
MFNNIKKYIRTYFGFSESETNGFIIFIPVIIAILFIPSLVKQYLLAISDTDRTLEEQMLMEWVAESERKLQLKDTSSFVPSAFDFDPNLASVEQFVELGFKEKVALRIENYREKGGQFRSKEDLLKIYGISKTQVNKLWDNIVIAQRKRKEYQQAREEKKTTEKETVKLIIRKNLNLATADSLTRIRGIGAVLSERIIKYRNSLGGFISTDQLSEVYGLKEEVIERIKEQYYTDTVQISKININADSITALARHPYISYSLAKIMIAYRDQHGDYNSIDELMNIKVMNDSLFIKLSPYLKADPVDLIE